MEMVLEGEDRGMMIHMISEEERKQKRRRQLG